MLVNYVEMHQPTFTRATELGDDIIVKGAFGEALGAIIVRTNKLEAGTAILAKKVQLN